MSKKYHLNKEDGKKILRGAGIAVGGALIVYILGVLPNVDFGTLTPLIVAIASILLNAGRKWISEQK